jgi:putative ABC transport system permease protein
MLKNFLITAARNLVRQRNTTAINVAGLMLGIAASLILFLLIKDQTSYDMYHSKNERIYRVISEYDGSDGRNYSAGVQAVFPDAFRNDFPEAELVTFTSYRSDAVILIPQKSGEPKKFYEERGVTFAEPEFFKIFDRPILFGDASTALDEPNEAIISRGLAVKYFGKEDARGEVVTREDKDYRIAAIMDDAPTNTDFPFTIMLSYASIKKENETNGWNSTWSDEQCYFLLKEGTDVAEIDRRMPAFVAKYIKDNTNHKYYLAQPLSELHYDDRTGNYNYKTMSKEMLAAFGIVAIFLVLTACINFVNLATAEAIKRSKEVGIRKSLGSTRNQLIGQFMGETSLVTVISMVIAVGLSYAALGFLNPFLETQLRVDLFSDVSLWLFIIVITFVVSLLSGVYPSFVISAYKPAQALKNQISDRNSSGYVLRKGLVVLQFFISQFFIIGTIVLISQMNFFMNKDLGFKKDSIITIPIPDDEKPVYDGGSGKMKTLRNEILNLSGVEGASLCNSAPSSGSVSGTSFSVTGKDEQLRTQVKTIDGNYVEMFGLTLLAGDGLADGDTAATALINERLMVIAGYTTPDAIVGKEIKMWGKRLPVAGVLKDFHTVSLHDPIEPTILLNRVRNYSELAVKLTGGDAQSTIDMIKSKWERAYPNALFSYEFLDQNIKEFYDRDRRMSALLTIFTGLAILIGCLGLFGLATFMANQKTKEIGVRKVLGASVENIVFLFSKEFIKLIVIGFLIAAPAAWYVMNQWLSEFAYRIELGPSVFVVGLALTFLVAMLTVGYRSFRAATVNPVDSLRSE